MEGGGLFCRSPIQLNISTILIWRSIDMNSLKKSILLISLVLFFSGCSSISSEPGVGSGQDPTQTAAPAGSASEEDDSQDESYTLESNPPQIACSQEDILLVVSWDHLWTWSPDGTEATGALIGQTKGTCNLMLSPDKNGDLGGDSCTFTYTQSGIIQGDPGQCKMTGEGFVDLTLSGVCQDGMMELEWMEVGTELQNASIVCDGKTSDFVMFYPAQAVIGVEVPEDGWAYQTSDSTILPLFRDVSMEWDVRLVPEGQTY